jgi:dehydrogenase/reductase SDR family protein 13
MSALHGKTYLVTGASSGIGKITARELAREGARVILACRSPAKATAALAELAAATGAADRLELVHLDLGDLGAVRACAEGLLARDLPLHGLINNAGLAGPRGLTADGLELAFGTNHVGPYLLTRLLLPRLEASGPARIVNVSSRAHFQARGIDWDAVRAPTRSLTGMPEYRVSKLANVLFTRELARRVDPARATIYAVHPGVVATDVWRRVPGPARWLIKQFMISPEAGARASLRCATDPALARDTGRYYDVGGVERAPSRVAQDDALARELWARSAGWTGLPD